MRVYKGQPEKTGMDTSIWTYALGIGWVMKTRIVEAQRKELIQNRNGMWGFMYTAWMQYGSRIMKWLFGEIDRL